MSNFLTCEQLEPLLSAYHDGELSEHERLEADKHISSCAVCQNRVLEIGAISSSLKALPRLTPKMDVAANIEKLIAAQPKAANQITRPLVWSVVGVAAAAAVVLFVGNLHSGPNVVPNQVASNSTVHTATNKKGGGAAASRDLEVASNAIDDPGARIVGLEKTQSVSEDSKKKVSPLPEQHGKPDAENVGKKERAKFNPHLQIASRANDGGTDTIPLDATQSAHLDQQTGADSQLIASETSKKVIGQSGDSNLVAVYDTDQRNVTEELGITTDEDGLYAIKL